MGWIKAWIPQTISNATLHRCLGVCGCLRVLGKRVEQNRVHNLRTLAEAAASKSFYERNKPIENQSQWGAVRFGRFSMDFSGCEIIATYNALLDLGRTLSEEDMADLIGAYERKGALLFGGFGVAPRAVYRYFLEQGYEAEMTDSVRREDINAIGEQYDALLITVYNDARDITQQIHTMNVSKDGEGQYFLHNSYRRDADGRYVKGETQGTLWDVIESIQGGKAAPIGVIGVRKENKDGIATEKNRHD